LKLQSVIAGLDPAIHPLRKEEDGCARIICAKTRFALLSGHDDLWRGTGAIQIPAGAARALDLATFSWSPHVRNGVIPSFSDMALNHDRCAGISRFPVA
jgi:hypothetical protein